jgi:hypothetical protein
MAQAFWFNPITKETHEVEITGYCGKEAYIKRTDGDLIRDRFFGMMTFNQVKLVPISEIMVAPALVS